MMTTFEAPLTTPLRPPSAAHLAAQLRSLSAAIDDLAQALSSQTAGLRGYEQQIASYRAQIRALQDLAWEGQTDDL
jgi:septal ring factor EnvC (AmiA/AmiB activator)